MPKFKILVHQYVEEVGHFFIEAKDAQAAADIANGELLFERCDSAGVNGDSTWERGDDAMRAEIWAIADEAGNIVMDVT